MTPKRTPLYGRHVDAGGKIVEFAGYEMPVQYASVIAEAKSVRENVGMFDVSHMARLSLTGTAVSEMLEWVTTNDITRLSDGGGQYSLLPNPVGGVVDDIIVYQITPEHFELVVNAANHAKDVAWLRELFGLKVQIHDHTAETAMIAVQGPRAAKILPMFADLPLFGTMKGRFSGVDVFAARSGYTGEDGFELVCPASEANALWNGLLAAGVTPCGLASRDTLRVEAGLPLYGHELTDETSPIAAGLGWVVGKTKSFVGSEAVKVARAEGTPRKLVGIKLKSKRVMAPGMKVFADGVEIGEVTSGVYSPVLERGIGFAYADSATKIGTEIAVEMRGQMEPGEISGKRFLKEKA
jgi:aminomethyltransferase